MFDAAKCVVNSGRGPTFSKVNLRPNTYFSSQRYSRCFWDLCECKDTRCVSKSFCLNASNGVLYLVLGAKANLIEEYCRAKVARSS
jgi:hypothetical protein